MAEANFSVEMKEPEFYQCELFIEAGSFEMLSVFVKEYIERVDALRCMTADTFDTIVDSFCVNKANKNEHAEEIVTEYRKCGAKNRSVSLLQVSCKTTLSTRRITCRWIPWWSAQIYGGWS